MEKILTTGNSASQLMTWEADPKKRKLNPKITISVLQTQDVNLGDVFIGQKQEYKVFEILERRPQNIPGRDLITFISST